MSQSKRIVYHNGQFVPEADARVPLYDSALVMGDMAYEVTRTFHQRPFRLREHLQRLSHSLTVLHIDPQMSLESLEESTLETLNRNLSTEAADVDWSIIHNISRGPSPGFLDAFGADDRRPTVLISCYPLVRRMAGMAAAYETGVDLVIPPQRAIPSSALDPTVKTRSRWYFQAANMQAASILPGSLAVLVDPAGNVTECTAANIFFVRGGELVTPHHRHVLSGVTRGLVIELAGKLGLRVLETDVTVDDARSSDEVFITATSIGVIHARSFDRLPIGDGRLGPVTAKLRQAIETEVGLDFAAQAKLYAQGLEKG